MGNRELLQDILSATRHAEQTVTYGRSLLRRAQPLIDFDDDCDALRFEVTGFVVGTKLIRQAVDAIETEIYRRESLMPEEESSGQLPLFDDDASGVALS